MFKRPMALLFMVLCTLSPTAWSLDAKDILQTMSDRLAERRAGVNSYIVDQTTMGRRMLTMYERTSVTVDGQAIDTFRVVPPDEIERRRGGNGQPLTPAQLDAFADAQERTGAGLKSEMERGMAEAGLPSGLLGVLGPASSSERWASPDPAIMMGANAEFLRGAADAQRNASDGSAEAAEGVQGMADFANKAQLVGVETLDGRSAYHLRADDLDSRQPMEGGGEFVIDAISLWVDKAEYVPLKMIATGEMLMEGQTRKIQIERLDTDYRPVAGSKMYEPHRSIMRMGGMMTEKEKSELAKSQVELQKMKQQLASMPESQRAMVERMMGPQLEMIEKMSAGNGIEVITEVHEIRVDQGLPDRQEAAEKAIGG